MTDDAAERAAAAERLAERYRSLVEHSPNGACVHEHGIIVYVNPAVVRMLGARSADELVGREVAQFVHPNSLPGMNQRIAELSVAEEGTASPPTEMTLVGVDGREVPVETISVVIPWHDRLAYQVVIHDLTAQRAAERAQRRAEQHFTAVVSQLEEGVAVVHRDGRILSANPAAHRILGFDNRHELVGADITRLPIPMQDTNGQPLSRSRHPVARTFVTGETISGFVLGVTRPDGQRRWLVVSSGLLTPGDPESAAVCSFGDITEYRASREQLEYQATHDSLTGLANRSLILSQLAGALNAGARRKVSTVLFVDLDGFKSINDTMGHAIGDTVLQIVAQRLQRALRTEDMVGRLGGDEFLVLLSGNPADEDLTPLVRRLRSTMAEPIVARGHRIAVNASIGVTTLAPNDRRTPEAVLHDADIAMYRNKAPTHRNTNTVPDRRPDNEHAS
ncbi:diguanylate cyclase domain-containing protein [Nocardia paucivorans]|uniref:diguanylate cyclase domain-containing protein n=1 Tax=Nocardia paucivorans TaxID=114259 RepID=UPI00031A936E|nr:diguanylate cyclase [Nocardia paucivorans]